MSRDRKSNLLSLLSALERNPELLNRRHLKKIYALLIASGHYPICSWCGDYIYNINDFTWDHIVPRSAGGADGLDNLQPMHKTCNNAMKENCLYCAEYSYDIKEGMQDAIVNVRLTVCKKQEPTKDKKKTKYNNKRCGRKNVKHR